MYPLNRNRRLRSSQTIRDLVRETSLSNNDFIVPIFAVEGKNIKNEILSMPGYFQLSLDLIEKEVAQLWRMGLKAVLVFVKVEDKLMHFIMKNFPELEKLARERAKKSNLHNKKLRDCRVHLGDMNKDQRLESTLFITEGDSASGSITKSRNVNTQAVFSLRGKPLNSYSMTKKIVYENEEFNLLQAALNIEEGIEKLRYNKVVIATDADVDGMHIRLLLITFFLQFFPELIKEGHLFILQTPLFRVRNKKETIYCYNDVEKDNAIIKLSPKPEITRFKGLGEISPNEFKNFIGETIRLDPVIINKDTSISEMLSFYMGKNTPERQSFIINNLKIDIDKV